MQAPKVAPTIEDRSRGINDMQFVFHIDYSKWKVNPTLQNSKFFYIQWWNRQINLE
jgi:hypothetical protein